MRRQFIVFCLFFILIISYIPASSLLGGVVVAGSEDDLTSIGQQILGLGETGFEGYLDVAGLKDDLAAIEAEILALEGSGFGDALDGVIDRVLASGRLVFLFFYADWCHFCKLEKPTIDELEGAYYGKIVFIRLNEAKNKMALEEFGVNGFPTMFLVYGKTGSTYLYYDFRGFKDKAFLESVIAQFVEGNTLQRYPSGDGECGISVGGLFSHESCSFWDCVEACKEKKEAKLDELLKELINTIFGCVNPYHLSTILTCSRLFKPEPGSTTPEADLEDAVGCAMDLLEILKKLPGGAGCVYSIGHALADLLGAKQLGECLGECKYDPSSYGQVCQPGEQRFVCASVSGFIKMQYCSSDCEWVTYPGSLRDCGVGKECVMTESGAECRDIDICEIEPSLPQCNDPNNPNNPNNAGNPSNPYNPSNPPIAPPTYPGMDRPDDNYDVSTSTYSSLGNQINGDPPFRLSSKRIIAVLNRGFYSGIAGILESLNQSYTLVDVYSLKYLDPKEFPALIVASGGLYGLEKSVLVRQNLESYASRGGKIIVFSQQRGVDFSVLPGGEVRGFGWVEDQSCISSSSILSVYHPILSGYEPLTSYQKITGTINVAVDGFFTNFPSNSITILTRDKTGTPAMILYGYGKGYVLASTLYSDIDSRWMVQPRTVDEVKLLRDMVFWALSEDTIKTYTFSKVKDLQISIPFRNPIVFSPSWPKFSRGDVVSIPVNVTNYGSQPADGVTFTLIDPYYNYWYVNVSVSIPPNQWRIVNLNYTTTSASHLGVWMVLYSLYNGGVKFWGSYYGAFTLDVDISDLSSFTAELTLLSPSVNRTSQEYKPIVTLRKFENVSFYALPAETRLINISFTPDSLGIWIIEYHIRTLNGMTVKTGSLFLAVSLYGENGFGWSHAGSEIRSSITTDKEGVIRGENVTHTVHIWNYGNKTQKLMIVYGFHPFPGSIWGTTFWSTGTHTSAIDPDRYLIINATIDAGSYINYTFVWPAGFDPVDIKKPYNFSFWHFYNFLYLTVFNGTYTEQCNMSQILQWKQTGTWHFCQNGYFVLSRNVRYLRGIDIIYHHFGGIGGIEWLDPLKLDKKSYVIGDNVTAIVRIISEYPYFHRLKFKFRVYDFTDKLIFEDARVLEVQPATYGPIIVNSTFQFRLPTTINYTALMLLGIRTPIYRIEVDFYLLNSLLHDGEISLMRARGWGPVTRYFYVEPFTGLDIALDKYQYKVREEITLRLYFFNKLSDPIRSNLTVNIPSLGFSNVTAIEIPPQQEKWEYAVKVAIPPSITPGYHEILVNYELEKLTREYWFYIPGSYLDAEPVEQTITTNELGLKILNTGGVDANYRYNIKLFGSYGYPATTHIIQEEAGTGTIQAEEIITRNYTIPENIVKMTPAQWIKDGFYKIYWINIELENLNTSYLRTIRLIYYMEAEPPSMLTAKPEKLSYAIGEEIGLEIKNIGGSATDYTYNLGLFDFPLAGGAVKLYESSSSGRLEAGAKTAVRFMVPSNAVKGVYYLKVDIQNLNNLMNSSDTFMIYIEGLNAALKSETDKKVYFLDEDVTIKTQIDNLDGLIQDATLNLQISGKKPCVIPHDDMYINEDTVLCPGTYSIKDTGTQGVLIINASNIVLDCNGAVLNGMGTTGYAIISFGWKDNVTIKSCKIINYRYGIYLNYAHNNTIINNEIQDMYYYGISLSFGSSNLILNNTLTNCIYGIYLARGDHNIALKNTLQSCRDSGIYIYTEEDDIIAKNTFMDNQYGIYFSALGSYYPNENITIAYNQITQSRDTGVYMRYTSDSLVFNNTITSSTYQGIYITTTQSNNNLILNNTIEKNRHGIYISVPTTVPPTPPPTNNVIASNIIRNNTEHGVYLENIQNTTIINNLIRYNGYSGIYLAQVNTRNILIANNTIEFSSHKSGEYTRYGGIHILRSANNTIIGNTVNSNKYYGIYLGGAKNNTIANNTIIGNYYGIYSKYENTAPANNGIYFNIIENNNNGIYADNMATSTIAQNIIKSNTQNGIFLYSASGNTIANNTITLNNIGIQVAASAGENSIYHNNLISNAKQAQDSRSAYAWDNGYPSGGNYWSDYTDVDQYSGPYQNETGSDGIWDHPYIIDSDSKDNYPFTNPNSWTPFDIPHFNISYLNVTINMPNIPEDPSDPDPPDQGEGGVIWERNITVTVVDALSLNTLVGRIGVAGKYYLTAKLYSSSTQMIAWDMSTFYITESDIHLIMKTDKKIYKPDEEITINGEVINKGNTAKTLTLTIKKNETQVYSETFTLDPNSSRPYTLVTSSNASFTLEGNVDGFTATEFIRIVEPQIDVTLTAPDITGRKPFTVTLEIQNKGEVPANLNVTLNGHKYALTVPANQTTLIQTEMSINNNTTLTATVTGDYQGLIQKEIVFGENAQLKVSPSQFYLEGRVDIPYNITNTGLLETTFNITFTINGKAVEKTIFLPLGGSMADAVTFNLTKGKYLLQYWTPFQEGYATVIVETPAEFIITYLPENETFHAGQTATLTVTLKNIGGTPGQVQVNMTVPGITEQTNGTLILPIREGNVSFSFEVPEDLEEKHYKAIFEIEGEKYEVKFFVLGAKIAVDALLDKQFYEEGENATLTLRVENLRNMNLTLFSRVALGSYDAVEYFNLTGYEAKTLNFSVPVVFNAGKLSYSVYMNSGRALYINALYVYPEPPESAGITLYTDKQVYEIGETATIYVNVTKQGRLTLTAPNLIVNTTVSPGIYIFNFEFPNLRSGTYPIRYTFINYSDSYPIDVIGYSARITSSELEKTTYTNGETINVTLIIDVNRNFKGLVKAWVFDPQGNVIGEAETNHTFTVGENKIKLSIILNTNYAGLHAMIYRIYAYGSLILLSSGSTYFYAEVTAQPDTTPPQIAYVDVTNALDENRPITINQPISINAIVTDNVKVEKVTLYYRKAGQQTYTKIIMTICPGCIDTYNATIPASQVTTATIEFYINATDGTNYATYPAANPATNPRVINVNLYPTAVVLNAPTEITENSMKLSWTESVDADFKNYTIYLSTSAGSLGNPIHAITTKSTTSYTVTGLTANTTYYFTIRVYDSGGLYADSNQVSAKTLETQQPPPQPAAPFPWMPITIGVAASALIIVIVAVVMQKRKRNKK